MQTLYHIGGMVFDHARLTKIISDPKNAPQSPVEQRIIKSLLLVLLDDSRDEEERARYGPAYYAMLTFGMLRAALFLGRLAKELLTEVLRTCPPLPEGVTVDADTATVHFPGDSDFADMEAAYGPFSPGPDRTQ